MNAERRPLGVRVVSIACFALGVILLPASLGAAAALTEQGRTGLGLALLLLPQALAIGAIGAWKLKRWGMWTLLVALFVFGFVTTQNLLARPAAPVVVFQGALLVVALAGFLYLGHPRTRARFE